MENATIPLMRITIFCSADNTAIYFPVANDKWYIIWDELITTVNEHLMTWWNSCDELYSSLYSDDPLSFLSFLNVNQHQRPFPTPLHQTNTDTHLKQKKNYCFQGRIHLIPFHKCIIHTDVSINTKTLSLPADKTCIATNIKMFRNLLWFEIWETNVFFRPPSTSP